MIPSSQPQIGFLGVTDKWLAFFRRFMETPVAWSHDGPGSQARVLGAALVNGAARTSRKLDQPASFGLSVNPRELRVESGGAVSISGCGLTLSDSGQLTGTLRDGTLINTSTFGLTAANLINKC